MMMKRIARPAAEPTPEQSAFVEEAMQRYGRLAFSYAYRLAGNEPDARDLTQEAFWRVFRSWHTYKQGSSFVRWLYQIITNLYRDALRKRKHTEILPLADDASNLGNRFVSASYAPIEKWHDRQLSEAMESALCGLSPELRTMVVLADVDDYSYADIARITSLPMSTVRTRLHRARARLRSLVLHSRQAAASAA